MSHAHKVLYAALIALLIFTFWPSGSDREGGPLGWDIQLDAAGRLQVFGVTLGQTPLKEAEQILRSQSQRALFIPPDSGTHKQPTVEAYFPSMPDGSKLVLGLAADAALIETLKSKAYNPFAFPSGSLKLEIAEEHMAAVNALRVETLTYIPRIRLTPADVQTKFGAAEQLIQQEGVAHFLYPAIGLDAILDQSGEAMLQFVNPSEFGRVTETLGSAPAPAAP